MKFVQFGGGLGDVYMRMKQFVDYSELEQLAPGEIAHVALNSVNPCVAELFAFHPKRNQMIVNRYPHWWPDEDAAMRQMYSLPPMPPERRRADPYAPIVVHRCPYVALPKLPDKYIALQCCAGESWKSIPLEIATDIVARCPIPVVAVGRSYPGQRETYRRIEYHIPGTLDYVDKLDIPDSLAVLQKATGIIACASFAHIVGWLDNVPMFILYPELLYEKCMEPMLKGQLNFDSAGLLRDTTVHGLFSDYSPMLLDYWLSAVL